MVQLSNNPDISKLFPPNLSKEQHAEINAEAAKIWKKLDEMATKDPQAYKKFIEQAFKEGAKVEKEEQLGKVLPGLCVRLCLRKGEMPKNASNFYLNICKTRFLPPPEKESDQISVTLGTLRRHRESSAPKVFENNQEDPQYFFYVQDVVIPWAAFEKGKQDSFFFLDLVRLAVNCARETTGLSLALSGREFETVKGEIYKGPFGWTPAGLPLSAEDAIIQAVKAEPNSVLANVNLYEEPDSKAGSESMSSIKDKLTNIRVSEPSEEPMASAPQFVSKLINEIEAEKPKSEVGKPEPKVNEGLEKNNITEAEEKEIKFPNTTSKNTKSSKGPLIQEINTEDIVLKTGKNSAQSDHLTSNDFANANEKMEVKNSPTRDYNIGPSFKLNETSEHFVALIQLPPQLNYSEMETSITNKKIQLRLPNQKDPIVFELPGNGWRNETVRAVYAKKRCILQLKGVKV